jgi:hypothetical protein
MNNFITNSNAKDLKKRLIELIQKNEELKFLVGLNVDHSNFGLIEEGNEVVTVCPGLKFKAADGKKYKTDCANTEGLFRIIQSIPSLKVVPFKHWL